MTANTPSAGAGPLVNDETALVRWALWGLVAFLTTGPLAITLLLWTFSSEAPRAMIQFNTASVLVLFVIGLAGIMGLRTGRSIARAHPWLLILGLLWLVIAGLAASRSQEPLLSASRTVWWILELTFGLSVLAALRAYPRFAPRIIVAWALGFLSLAAVILYYVIAGPRHAEPAWQLNIPGAINIRFIGFDAMCAAVIGSLYRPEAAPRTVLILRLAAVAGWAVLFWSGGRGSLIGAVLAIAAVAIVCRPPRGKALLEIAALVLIGLLIAALHTPPSAVMGVWRTLGLETAAARSLDEIGSGRWLIWRDTSEVILAHPLLGIGEGQAHHVKSIGDHIQPHNVVLQAGLAWGLIGGSAFLIAVAYGLFRAIQVVRRSSFASAAAAGLAVSLALAFSAMFDGTLYHLQQVSLFLTGLALAMSFDPGTFRAEAAAESNTPQRMPSVDA